MLETGLRHKSLGDLVVYQWLKFEVQHMWLMRQPSVNFWISSMISPYRFHMDTVQNIHFCLNFVHYFRRLQVFHGIQKENIER